MSIRGQSVIVAMRAMTGLFSLSTTGRALMLLNVSFADRTAHHLSLCQPTLTGPRTPFQRWVEILSKLEELCEGPGAGARVATWNVRAISAVPQFRHWYERTDDSCARKFKSANRRIRGG